MWPLGPRRKGRPVSRAFRRTALAIQQALNRFDPAARGADVAALADDGAPVFILSVPRSGSTLLYQLMARSMGFGAITNLMALAPCAMVRLARYSNARRPGPEAPLLPGHYGFLPGLHGLSEAGKVLERWFDPTAGEAHRQRVREMAAAVGARSGGPLLVKSLSLVLRLDALAATLPEARLVILRRDPRFVVQSLLRGVADPAIAEDQWEGVRPPGYAAQAALDPVRRTAWQVAELAKAIESGRRLFQPGRVVEIGYEALCDAPRAELARVAAALGRPFATSAVPERLSPAMRREPAADWARIEASCKEFNL